jgi:light-regulated signal transduction histidine kinase (bacteriophytochrome)/CheY-like chemotaxis protein
MTDDVDPIGIDQCDREPIHIPGSIQSFGCLVACGREDWVVSHVSANGEDFGLDPQSIMGRTLKDAIGREQFHAVSNALSASTAPGLPGRVFDLTMLDGRNWNLTVHAHGNRSIVELEPVRGHVDALTPLVIVRSMLARMHDAANVTDLCNLAVRQIRALIGFDRVMIYQFLHDGSGSVIAENRANDLSSFLEHHYPASDIPRQARELYLKSWLRQIADVAATPIPIVAAPEHAAPPLDMTYSALRSVSPVHIEYLRNMQVAASLSISIIVAGQLWGLIACHNGTPRVVPSDVRVTAELFGQAFSLQLQTLARADVADMLRQARTGIDRIISALSPDRPLAETLGSRLADVAKILPCDGAGLWLDGTLHAWGSHPPEAAMPALVECIGQVGDGGVFSTHALAQTHPPAISYAAEVSGLLALPLSRDGQNLLMLFRREFVRTISWAGNPAKAVEISAGAPRLSPRKSFALWSDEVRHQSSAWSAPDRLTAEALRTALLEIVLRHSELVAVERERADHLQRVQTAEFNHRVKNALALVAALVAQSKIGHTSLPSFVADLEGRLNSLSLAHDLASRHEPLELRKLLEAELHPFEQTSIGRIELEGPAVWFTEHAARVMALVVHELTTNAAKHGALKSPDGTISVRWHRGGAGDCEFDWIERCATPVAPSTRTGFGSLVIRRQIPFELGGRSELSFTPHGLEVHLHLPASGIADPPPTTILRGNGLAAPAIDRSSTVLDGRSVLVVEDSLMIALRFEQTLKHLGAAQVWIAGTLDEAMSLLSTERLDLVVLDVDLKGTPSFPLADVLLARGVPFFFETGYGLSVQLPVRFARVPVISKPPNESALIRALATVTRSGGP